MENGKIKILKTEKNYIAVIKKAGMICERANDKTKAESMVNELENMLGTEVFPVHRLDKETSGVMIYALTGKGAAALGKTVSDGGFHKTYLAAAEGIFDEKSGKMEDFLYRDAKKNKSYVVKTERKGVKKAVLEYEVLSEKKIGEKEFSLVRIKLFTGRTHQIRVQFSHRSHPLAGDKKYGSRTDLKDKIALFSEQIEFFDPFSKKNVFFEAKPEEEPFSYFEK
ncbi:MAG: RluA family pseudouridine synthase [Clostridiales bacterium]|nr:RluA family pseudouridine synthase [Clostridiales bacterium]